MSRAPDRQRSRVYAWENAVVAVVGGSTVPFAQAQGMVDAIWSDLGLLYSPRVEPLPRQSRSLQADASRLRVRLPDVFPSWLLLHELAHALSSSEDGQSDGHGPTFVGLYVQLLVRYMRFPASSLTSSIKSSGIAIDLEAKPIFLDP